MLYTSTTKKTLRKIHSLPKFPHQKFPSKNSASPCRKPPWFPPGWHLEVGFGALASNWAWQGQGHQVKPGPLFGPPFRKGMDVFFHPIFWKNAIPQFFFQVAIVCYVCSFFMGNHILFKLFATKRGERMLISYKLFWGKVSNETWGLPSIGFGQTWSGQIEPRKNTLLLSITLVC